MRVIQKELKVTSSDYYLIHLNIINSVFPVKLTEKEIAILAGFMALEHTITGVDMFNSYARKIVKERLGGMSSASLSNHLKSMLDKGFLTKDEETNRIFIKEFLLPEEDWQGYQFKLVKNEVVRQVQGEQS